MQTPTDNPASKSDAPPTERREAAAKINLFLTVRRRRSDGYHVIETVFLPLPGLRDTVAVEDFRPGEIRLAADRPELPTDRKNLCWQAAAAFAESANLTPGWRISIEKRIPVAAGLGGGSSDAAATLQLLNLRYGSPLAPRRLHAIAASLGADIPFFLQPRPALAGGIGDRLEDLELNCEIPLVLLNPGLAPLTAAWAYSTIKGEFDRLPATPMVEAMRNGDLNRIAAAAHNRFDRAVCRKMPLVAIFLEFLQGRGCLTAHVSGSGPTVYGICRDREQALSAAAAARRRFGRAAWVWVGGAMRHHQSTDN